MTAPAPRPWTGTVYRHLPAGSPYEPLDTRYSAHSRENRWNPAGESTLILSGDRALPAIEFERHLTHDRNSGLAALYLQRQLFAVKLRLQRTFDLTDPATLDALGIEGAPDCFSDRSRARATAGFLRHARNADGLIVPSLAVIGDPARWNLLVFLDRLTEPLDAAVLGVTALSTVQPVRSEPLSEAR
jgi:RES domain-containing protein